LPIIGLIFIINHYYIIEMRILGNYTQGEVPYGKEAKAKKEE
jgi:hypothetical protein